MTDESRAAARGEADRFVGRERELRELSQLVRTRRAVTLCGPAGIGKTRLLRALTAGRAARYPDGAFVVSLGDLRQPDLVASQVATAIGVIREPGVPVLEALADALRGRRLVLALDHCDHLADPCARLGQQLLASSPGLLLLATRRAPRPIAGEVTWPVPPLALPPAGGDPAGGTGGDGIALFAERAAAAVPGFAVTAGNRAAVAEIGRLLDGLPLAIELAAARLRVLTVDQLAGSLRDRLELLAGDAAAAPPAHLTLWAAVDWTHDQLAGPEQVLLRRLSVFAGWPQEMAERVCADDGLPAPGIGALLARLGDSALVGVEPDYLGQTRYRMLDAVREYAADRLAAAREAAALHRRLRDFTLTVSDYYLAIGLARVPALWSARLKVFQRYRAEAGNIRSALDWCLRQGDIEGGLRLCAAFGACWLALGESAEAARWFGAFLSADQSGVPASARGPALAGGGYLLLGDDPQRARQWAAEGLEACRAAGDLIFASAALNLLGLAALGARRPREALRHGEEALAQSRACGDRWSEALALSGTAAARAALGALPEARKLAEAGVTVMLEIDHQWGAARALLDLAGLCRALGDLDSARRHYLTALDLLSPVKGTPEIGRGLAGLGGVALDQGDLDAARSYLAQGLRLSLRRGRRGRIAGSLLAMADLAVRENRPDRAVQLAAAATALRPPRSPAVPASAGAARGDPQAEGRAPADPLTEGRAPAGPQAEGRASGGQAAGGQPAGDGDPGDGAAAPSRRVQRCLDAAAGLGSAEIARLWAGGLALTPGAAADLALRPPSAVRPP
jgi:predicted ATPase